MIRRRKRSEIERDKKPVPFKGRVCNLVAPVFAYLCPKQKQSIYGNHLSALHAYIY